MRAKLLKFFKSKTARWIFLPAFVLIVLRGCVYEPYFALRTERMELPAAHWPAKLSDIKIAVVSDLHAGEMPFERWRISQVVAAVEKENPDIVLFLGDFVNGFRGMSAMDIDDLGGIISRLNPPLGMFAVSGNHDAARGEAKIAKTLKPYGVKFLRDENVEIKTPKGNFYIVGAIFRSHGAYHFNKAFSGVPAGAPVILMIHSPEIFPAIPRKASIAFAGHTHGGQIRLPYIGGLARWHTLDGTSFDSGLVYSPRDIPLYVTRGVGTSNITLRFLCPPQIEIVTLKPLEK